MSILHIIFSFTGGSSVGLEGIIVLRLEYCGGVLRVTQDVLKLNSLFGSFQEGFISVRFFGLFHVNHVQPVVAKYQCRQNTGSTVIIRKGNHVLVSDITGKTQILIHDVLPYET